MPGSTDRDPPLAPPGADRRCSTGGTPGSRPGLLTSRPEPLGRTVSGRVRDHGAMTEVDVTALVDQAASNVRAVIAALADPDDELRASAATRHRLEGAALALAGRLSLDV
jgi:hypothetical protein